MTLDRVRPLLPMLLALVFAAAMFTLAAPHALGAPWVCGLLAVLALVWVALQPPATSRDDTLPALAIAIAFAGSSNCARTSTASAKKRRILRQLI